MPEWQLQRRRLRGHRRAGAGGGPRGRAGRRRSLRLLLVARGGDGAGARAAVPARGCGCCRWLSRCARWRSCSAGWRCSGLPLTMASIAVLPVLLGLGGRLRDPVPGADREEGPGGRARARCRRSRPPRWRPAVGFLVLLLSPVPMVRGFGALLVVGVGVALALALTGGHGGADVLAAPAGAASAGARPGALGARRRRSCVDARRAARRGLRAGPARRASARRCASSSRSPAGCSWSALALAASGWALDTRSRSSPTAAARPAGPRAVRDLDALQRDTGVAGEVDVARRGARPDRPEGVAWMRAYQQRLLTARLHAPRTAAAGGLCPALSLPDLFRDARAAATRERSARCWTPCRRTSRRPRSPPTGAPRCSRSASACSRWRRSAR